MQLHLPAPAPIADPAAPDATIKGATVNAVAAVSSAAAAAAVAAMAAAAVVSTASTAAGLNTAVIPIASNPAAASNEALQLQLQSKLLLL